MILSDIPTFAIVGHPNKGKSSIVATLAQDSAIDISPTSGTTVAQHAYPMQIDGTVLYRLIDTPGFQRARAAMEWMQKYSRNASDHAAVVRDFIDQHKNHPKFSAEVELLQPILEGAGILYVVDGSKPYGPEYDTEMEILRWTGQPSMALINQIGDGDYTVAWQQPLSQYFRIVRPFNAQSASFDRQVQLLTGFSELSSQWYEPLQKASSILIDQRHRRITEAASRISDMLIDMLQQVEVSSLDSPDNEQAIELLVDRYRQNLKLSELTARSDVETLFNYSDIDRQENQIGTLAEDLFSERSWQVFGLSRDQLMTTGIIGGAAAGSMLDIGSGGLTMFLGSGLGAIVGGASAWFGSQQLVGTKILGLPMGGHQLEIGPVSNINFPWVLIGRAVTHLRQILQRNHARRDALQVIHIEGDFDQQSNASSLSKSERGKLQAIFSRARNGKTISSEQHAELCQAIVQLAEDNRRLTEKVQ